METGWLVKEKIKNRIKNSSSSMRKRNEEMEKLKKSLFENEKDYESCRVSVGEYTGLIGLKNGNTILFGSFDENDVLKKYAIVTYDENDKTGLWTKASDGKRMLIQTKKIKNWVMIDGNTD